MVFVLQDKFNADHNISLTISPGPWSTSLPSGVFIHTAVWPQQTWARNWVGAVPFFLRGAVSPITIEQSCWAKAYLHTK